MLNKMNGNFSLVSEKIGLSKESLIRKYLDHVKISPMNTLINKHEAVQILMIRKLKQRD